MVSVQMIANQILQISFVHQNFKTIAHKTDNSKYQILNLNLNFISHFNCQF